MREILFRGKRTNNGEWVEGGIIPLDIDSGYVFIAEPFLSASTLPIYEIIKHHTHLVIPKTIGQFTGLYDKNGKKIFEGDILSTENGTFSNTGMGYICLYKGMWVSFYGQDALGRDCYDELYTICNTREIVGNIHDNPELIND